MKELESLKKQLAEMRVSEQLLSAKLEELNDFIENAAIPLQWVDVSGIIVWANKAVLDLLGYTKDEYLNKHISNFHADKKVIEDILHRLINKETLKNYQSQLKAKNGTVIPVLINSNVRWDGSRFLHTRCFTVDVSYLKKLEAEKIELINTLQEQNSAQKQEISQLKKQIQVKVK
jgi:two-component system sensor histidine kinase VicK